MKQYLPHWSARWAPSLSRLTGRRRRVDPETGLWIGEAFVASAEQELARAARFGRPLALLAIDVRPPERPTQQALQAFAQALRQHTRGFDLIGRTDDGLFLALLPESGLAEVMAVADRIITEALACLGLSNPAEAAPDPIRIGVAVFPDDGAVLKELIARARAGLARSAAEPDPAVPAPPPVDQQRLHQFVVAVVAAGIIVLAVALPSLSPALLLTLLPFLLLAVVTERLPPLKHGDMTISIGGIVTLTAAAAAGPAAGALVGLVIGLARWQAKSLPSIKGAFNAALFTLSAAAAGLPYWLVGGTPSISRLLLLLLLGPVAGLLFIIVNNVLLAKVLALSSGRSWGEEWRLHCNWIIGHYAVMGAVGLGLASLYQDQGIAGLLLFIGPIALLYYAQRQYVTHTVAHVAELSSLNQELTTSNQRLTYANTLLAQTLSDLRRANEAMLTAFSEALEFRDQETEGHSQRVVHYARALAGTLNLPPDEIQEVVHGALLHDIGKIGVRDSILLKTGALSPEEWAEMKRHPEIGYRMIAGVPFLATAALLVRHHHERWDGRGYPMALAAHAIPLGARIFAVADAFDAMTSDRPYRRALSCDEALRELARCSGTQFDPAIVVAFIRLVTSGELPPLAAAAPAAAPGDWPPANGTNGHHPTEPALTTGAPPGPTAPAPEPSRAARVLVAALPPAPPDPGH